jgi:hypothetical protein
VWHRLSSLSGVERVIGPAVRQPRIKIVPVWPDKARIALDVVLRDG